MWPQAAQAVEPAALIPLQMLKPNGNVVLVGDPKQLPATVMSRAADRAGLSRSLFERLQQVRCPARVPTTHLHAVDTCMCLQHACTFNPHMFGDNRCDSACEYTTLSRLLVSSGLFAAVVILRIIVDRVSSPGRLD